jgi:hypothetical protein
MEEYVMNAAKEYPNKRLILHFLQPHCPFIGETGQEYYNPEKRNFWGDVMDGKTDTNHLREAYRENLEAVLPTVRRIMQRVEGKHVVTSDHGQFIGEQSYPIPNVEWGHPSGLYLPPVIRVPWLEYINECRRDIQSELQKNNYGSSINDNRIKNRLAHLGYIDN